MLGLAKPRRTVAHPACRTTACRATPRQDVCRRGLAAALLLAVLLAIAAHPAPAQGRDPATHPAIAEAVAEARRTLPQFMARWHADEPQDTGYALKIAIGDQHGTEHLWVTRLQRRDGRIFGTIDTRPLRLRSHASGQRIEVRPDAIVDWMYFRSGRIVGNHTGRAMLRYLPAAEAERLRLLYE